MHQDSRKLTASPKAKLTHCLGISNAINDQVSADMQKQVR